MQAEANAGSRMLGAKLLCSQLGYPRVNWTEFPYSTNVSTRTHQSCNLWHNGIVRYLTSARAYRTFWLEQASPGWTNSAHDWHATHLHRCNDQSVTGIACMFKSLSVEDGPLA